MRRIKGVWHGRFVEAATKKRIEGCSRFGRSAQHVSVVHEEASNRLPSVHERTNLSDLVVGRLMRRESSRWIPLRLSRASMIFWLRARSRVSRAIQTARYFRVYSSGRRVSIVLCSSVRRWFIEAENAMFVRRFSGGQRLAIVGRQRQVGGGSFETEGRGLVIHRNPWQTSSITRNNAGTISKMMNVAKRIPKAIEMAMGMRNFA